MIVRVHVEVIDPDQLNKTIEEKSFESKEISTTNAEAVFHSLAGLLANFGLKELN